MGTFLKLLYMEVLLATAASLLWGVLGYQPHVQGTDLSYSCDLCNSRVDSLMYSVHQLMIRTNVLEFSVFL